MVNFLKTLNSHKLLFKEQIATKCKFYYAEKKNDSWPLKNDLNCVYYNCFKLYIRLLLISFQIVFINCIDFDSLILKIWSNLILYSALGRNHRHHERNWLIDIDCSKYRDCFKPSINSLALSSSIYIPWFKFSYFRRVTYLPGSTWNVSFLLQCTMAANVQATPMPRNTFTAFDPVTLPTDASAYLSCIAATLLAKVSVGRCLLLAQQAEDF